MSIRMNVQNTPGRFSWQLLSDPYILNNNKNAGSKSRKVSKQKHSNFCWATENRNWNRAYGKVAK